MKINAEKYPILEKLEKGIFGVIGMAPSDAEVIPMHSEALEFIRDTFKSNIPFFKKSIKFLSSPLVDAMLIAREKLLKTDLILELGSSSGTFLMGDYQYCYSISAKPGEENWQYVCFAFSGGKFMGFSGEDGKKSYNYASAFVTPTPQPSIIERQEVGKRLFGNVLLAINFLKYADIETKTIGANRQIFDGIKCLYNNKCKYPIEIIDSTWFTTLVKSEGFKVRGHFRLQPFGEGLTKRKLVWINEFHKDGYTRQAKILNEQ